MRDESKREGEIQDDKTFNGEMRAKKFSRSGMVLKLTAGCGMRDGKRQITRYRRDRDKYPDWGGMAGSRQK